MRVSKPCWTAHQQRAKLIVVNTSRGDLGTIAEFELLGHSETLLPSLFGGY
jgi:hypothetical protein